MANFRSEGHATMTGTNSVFWQIEPLTPPRPFRHCTTCGGRRVFRSSGRIRLNANGHRLDAWLIYKCVECDNTWNRPLVERTPLAAIARSDLLAMHANDPEWVRAREFDLVALGRHCAAFDIPTDLRVTKSVQGSWCADWSVLGLTVLAPLPTGSRLDRLLAGELGLSRSELGSMLRTGGLDPGQDRALRKPVAGRCTVRFLARHLAEPHRMALSRGIAPG
jgi:hypothetical protein